MNFHRSKYPGNGYSYLLAGTGDLTSSSIHSTRSESSSPFSGLCQVINEEIKITLGRDNQKLKVNYLEMGDMARGGDRVALIGGRFYILFGG